LVETLWSALGGSLPIDCRWVLCGTPVLAHPASGKVFGFAMGSLSYALRVPAQEMEAALELGAARVHRFSARKVLDLAQIADSWVLGSWRSEEVDWCRAALRQAL